MSTVILNGGTDDNDDNDGADAEGMAVDGEGADVAMDEDDDDLEVGFMMAGTDRGLLSVVAGAQPQDESQGSSLPSPAPTTGCRKRAASTDLGNSAVPKAKAKTAAAAKAKASAKAAAVTPRQPRVAKAKAKAAAAATVTAGALSW